jgi:hypothetical protein
LITSSLEKLTGRWSVMSRNIRDISVGRIASFGEKSFRTCW